MRKFVSLGLCLGLLGCGSSQYGGVVMAASEADQTAALRSCHAALNISGPLQLYTLELDDGRTLVTARDGQGVSLAEARSINDCRTDRLVAQSGGIFDAQTYNPEGSSAPTQTRADYVPELGANPQDNLLTLHKCNAVMIGGSGYCVEE